MGLTLGLGLNQEERGSVLDLTANMMKVSGRPFSLLNANDDGADWVDACRREGLPLIMQQTSTAPAMEFKLAEFNLYDFMPNWIQPLVGDVKERSVKLRDPETRSAMRQDIEDAKRSESASSPAYRMTDWGRMRVLQVFEERNEQYEGMTVEEVAKLQGKHPLDAFLDLALDEELQTEYHSSSRGYPGRGEGSEARTARSSLPHLGLRWWRPHQVQHSQHVAYLLAESLDPGQRDHDFGAGSLQDECAAGLDNRFQGPGHSPGRETGRT